MESCHAKSSGIHAPDVQGMVPMSVMTMSTSAGGVTSYAVRWEMMSACNHGQVWLTEVEQLER